MTKEFKHLVTGEAVDDDLDDALLLARAGDGTPLFTSPEVIIDRAHETMPHDDWLPTINQVADAKITQLGVPLTAGLANGRYELQITSGVAQWVPAAAAGGTPPAAPVINAVATNDSVSPTEAAAGVTITGTAEASSTVSVVWGSVNKSTTATGGNWSVSYSSAEIPAVGASTVSASASNSSGTGNTTTRSVTIEAAALDTFVEVISGGYRANSATYGRLYGPGVNVMDALNNMECRVVSSTASNMSVRFMALSSGTLSSIKCYFPDGTGYAAGSGGTCDIKVYRDNSSTNRPDFGSGTVATGSRVLAMSGGVHINSSDVVTNVTMTSTSSLVAGNVYHAVFENTTASPSVNWFSINTQYSVNGKPRRWQNPIDWALLRGSRASASATSTTTWEDWTTDGVDDFYYSPIMQFNLSGGGRFGNGVMVTGNWYPDRTVIVTSTNPVRERFTPTTSKQVSGLSVSTAALVGGNLTWALKQGSTVLRTGTITQSTANHSLVYQQIGSMTWYDAEFSPVTLAAGTVYDLEFTGSGSSQFVFGGFRNGADYGFAYPSSFTESQAQHKYSGNWINYYPYDLTDNFGDSNWRVVLHQAS